MPKRTDIHKILIIGAGPIIIGQACEFDYSGTQACKALKEEGYQVVLVNSNPATIMTDPETADRTYIEPVTPETVAKIIEKERPDALLPTLGGQTGLNTAVEVARQGTLADLVARIVSRHGGQAGKILLDPEGRLDLAIQVMVNDEGFLPRNEYSQRVLKDGDTVKFMLLVGGG